jgi:hypothetical protein
VQIVQLGDVAHCLRPRPHLVGICRGRGTLTTLTNHNEVQAVTLQEIIGFFRLLGQRDSARPPPEAPRTKHLAPGTQWREAIASKRTREITPHAVRRRPTLTATRKVPSWNSPQYPTVFTELSRRLADRAGRFSICAKFARPHSPTGREEENPLLPSEVPDESIKRKSDFQIAWSEVLPPLVKGRFQIETAGMLSIHGDAPKSFLRIREHSGGAP